MERSAELRRGLQLVVLPHSRYCWRIRPEPPKPWFSPTRRTRLPYVPAKRSPTEIRTLLAEHHHFLTRLGEVVVW
jgi:hypothetical protein